MKLKLKIVTPILGDTSFPSSHGRVSIKGKLISGTIGNRKVLVMQGRFHFYEGYSMQQITSPIRVIGKTTGCSKSLLNNAAGGINKDFKKTDLVVIDDHINLLPENLYADLMIRLLGIAL